MTITMNNYPKTLLIIAHPSLKTGSKANLKLAEAATKHVTTVHNLYDAYEHHSIDIQHEQKLLLEHDRIIFQFPIWWYSSPSLLKQWLDEVLQYGFAYGEGGTKLHGKEFGLAVTAGGGEYAYSPEGYNRFPLEELMRPFEATANLIGMTYLPLFAVYNTMQLTDEELEAKASEYVQYLSLPSNKLVTV